MKSSVAAGAEAQVDLGMLLVEIGEPRQQPLLQESAEQADVEQAAAAILSELLDGASELAHAALDAGQQPRALRREAHRAPVPHEQRAVSSSDLMCELTAAVVTLSDCAAPVKLRWAATASNARSAFNGSLVASFIVQYFLSAWTAYRAGAQSISIDLTMQAIIQCPEACPRGASIRDPGRRRRPTCPSSCS